MSSKVDARGLACPQPLLVTKKALDAIAEGVVTTIVDNDAAKENVSKFAVSCNCKVSVEEKDGLFYITIVKGSPSTEEQTQSREEVSGINDVVYLISKNTLGTGSEELGAILMKSFLYTLVEGGDPPKKILFINSGVYLTIEGSPVIEHLKALAEKGVEIVSCGTCLDYFDLKDKLVVGGITNMYNILAALKESAKAITL